MQMQADQLWQAVLGQLQARLSRSAFDNWLRQTTLVDFVDDVAVVAAPNTFSVSTLQTRYAAQVEQELASILGRPIRVRFTIMNSEREDARHEEPTSSERRPEPRRVPEANRPRRVDSPPPQPNQLELAPTTAHGLNPRYVYANYVVGSSNRFAHAASLSVAEKPGGMYNPFFIHGGVGLGKTHLLHAIGHRALELRPNLSIVYVSSEKFTNDVINGIRTQRMDDFRSRYRTIDILMIDDIQFIAGKESTQEEFFHTFNTLYQSGKQVVITSDKPPKAIAALE